MPRVAAYIHLLCLAAAVMAAPALAQTAQPELSSADMAPTSGWEVPREYYPPGAESRISRTPSVQKLPTLTGRFQSAKNEPTINGHPSPMLVRLGQQRLTYHVIDQSLEQAFREVGQLVGASVLPGNGVRGALRNRLFDGTAVDVLDAMAKEQNLMWFTDGAAIYVEPVEDSRSRTFRVKDIKREQIDDAMLGAGLDRHRHRIQFAPNENAVRAYGPESFLKVVEGMLAGVQPEVAPDINMIKFGRRADK